MTVEEARKALFATIGAWASFKAGEVGALDTAVSALEQAIREEERADHLRECDWITTCRAAEEERDAAVKAVHTANVKMLEDVMQEFHKQPSLVGFQAVLELMLLCAREAIKEPTHYCTQECVAAPEYCPAKDFPNE